MHFISSSESNISQQPFSLQGTVQLIMVLELRSAMHPNTLLYDSVNSFSKRCASCCVSNLRCSFKNVKPNLPVRTSGFSTFVQIALGIDGGMMRVVVLLFDASIPAATAAATTTLTDTVTVVVVDDASIPNGPTGATAAVPPALTPAAQEVAAFCDAAMAIEWTCAALCWYRQNNEMKECKHTAKCIGVYQKCSRNLRDVCCCPSIRNE
jgi:hypothetical protein